MKVAKIGMIIILTAIASAAVAKGAFMQAFQENYKIEKGSTIQKASCKLCHSTGTKLNPYGTDIKKAKDDAKSKTVTPDILKSVEALDSDGDGVTNIDEIKADTLPGDPASHPDKVATPAPTK